MGLVWMCALVVAVWSGIILVYSVRIHPALPYDFLAQLLSFALGFVLLGLAGPIIEFPVFVTNIVTPPLAARELLVHDSVGLRIASISCNTHTPPPLGLGVSTQVEVELPAGRQLGVFGEHCRRHEEPRHGHAIRIRREPTRRDRKALRRLNVQEPLLTAGILRLSSGGGLPKALAASACLSK